VQHTPYLAFSCVVASAQGQAGTPCLNDTECAFGFGCRDATELSGCDGQRCCTPYCLTGSDCEDGMICSPFFEGPNVPPEVSEVGICVVP
jgi:hypothetical protein